MTVLRIRGSEHGLQEFLMVKTATPLLRSPRQGENVYCCHYLNGVNVTQEEATAIIEYNYQNCFRDDFNEAYI